MRCRQKQSGYALGNPARGGAARLHLCANSQRLRLFRVIIFPRENYRKKIVAGLEAPATFRLSSFPVFPGVTRRLLQLIGDLPVADQLEACVVRGPQRASEVVMKRPVSTIVNGAADQTA